MYVVTATSARFPCNSKIQSSDHFSKNHPSTRNSSQTTYGPISNLSLLFKLSERVVLPGLNGYLSNLTSYNLLNSNQSAYTKQYRDTSYLAIQETSRGNWSSSSLFCVPLRHSVAFDAIDHHKL